MLEMLLRKHGSRSLLKFTPTIYAFIRENNVGLYYKAVGYICESFLTPDLDLEITASVVRSNESRVT